MADPVKIESVKDALMYLVAEAERKQGMVNVFELGLTIGLKKGEQLGLVVKRVGLQPEPIAVSQLHIALPIGRYWAGIVFIPADSPNLATATLIGTKKGD